MKSTFPVALIVCMTAIGLPVKVQGQTSPHFAEARRVLRSAGGHVEEVEGLLAADVTRQQIRFEIAGQAAFAVPYANITALHYESSVDASKWGWPLKNSNHYLTIHYLDAPGHATFEILRISERDVARTLDALENESGLTINRSAARRSFPGIPIRAAIGDHVAITDMSGRDMEGTITQISPSSLELAGPGATPWVFDASSTTRIRRTRSKSRDALKSWLIGALAGSAAYGAIASSLIQWDTRAVVMGAIAAGGMVGGLSASISAATPSYHHRATRDIYVNVP